MAILLDDGKKQYKANLHAHSTESDGKLSVNELTVKYKAEGYSVLAITDHETPLRHSGLSTDDFLLLDGYEAYIRPSSKCIFNRFKPEIHLNLIAKSQSNKEEWMEAGHLPYLGYNFFYTKYFDKKSAKKLDVARKLKRRRFTTHFMNNFIECAHDAGYFVFLNHPYWSMMEQKELFELNGIDSVEIFNYSSMLVNDDEGDVKFYDSLLRHNKRTYIIKKDDKKPFCHGSDDNHNSNKEIDDSFGAFTYILADSLDYDSISKAIEKGDYYASTGPKIKKIEISGNNAHIWTDDCKSIIMHVTPKFSCRKYSKDDEPLNEAVFKIPGSCNFVYFSVRDKEGKRAVTRYYDVKH